MTVSQDQVVSIHYTLRDDEGEVIDRSADGEPLTYLHGHGQLILGLKHQLLKTIDRRDDGSLPHQPGHRIADRREQPLRHLAIPTPDRGIMDAPPDHGREQVTDRALAGPQRPGGGFKITGNPIPRVEHGLVAPRSGKRRRRVPAIS